MFVDDTSWDFLIRGIVLSSVSLLWVVVLVRINGLRSLSKMTNFDFVMTIAMGSLVAGGSQSTEWTGFGQTIAAMAALFAFQYGAARLRRASETMEAVLQNEPLLLMRDGVICDAALAKTRMTRSDIYAKLRQANVLSLSDVRAVVLETTGDVSVMQGSTQPDAALTGTVGEVGERD